MTNTALLKRTLGERLAKSRHVAQLGQQDIADLLGVSRRTVVRWENDEGFPRVDQVEKWAELTDVPLLWILKDEEGGGVTDSVSVKYPTGDTPGATRGYPFIDLTSTEPFSRDMGDPFSEQ
jgi:transcriptional regulator with XRE-family HTH domain